mgnify:CR=1 FL=1
MQIWKYIKQLWYTQRLSVLTIALSVVGIICSLYFEKDKLITLFGNIIAIVIGLFIYKAQRRILPWDIIERLDCEFKEMTRHLERNFDVLESIDTTQGIPSVIHIKKLKIDDHTTLYDNDILKNLPISLAQKIYPMTIRVRNYNITIDCIENIITSKDTTLLNDYLKEIKIVTKILQKDIYNDYICDYIKELPIKNENKENENEINEKITNKENEIKQKINNLDRFRLNTQDISNILKNIEELKNLYKSKNNIKEKDFSKEGISNKVKEIESEIKKIKEENKQEENKQEDFIDIIKKLDQIINKNEKKPNSKKNILEDIQKIKLNIQQLKQREPRKIIYNNT